MRKFDLSLPRFHPLAFAVWYRNLMVWRRLLGSMVMLHFGEPMIWLVGLGVGMAAFIPQMDDMDYLTYLACGYMASSTMISVTMEGMYAVYTRMASQGTYDGMMNTPMKVDDIVAGEMLWSATKGVLTTGAILIVAFAFGAKMSMGVVMAIPLGFLVGFAFVGMAMCMSAISPGYDFFNYYFTLIITPLFVLSGVFYPIDTLPHAVQGIVQFLPLYHAVELMRAFGAGLPLEGAWIHFAVLMAYGLAGHYGAVVLMRRRLVV